MEDSSTKQMLDKLWKNADHDFEIFAADLEEFIDLREHNEQIIINTFNNKIVALNNEIAEYKRDRIRLLEKLAKAEQDSWYS